MSGQPRLFTAKRHADTKTAPPENQTRHREQQRGANAQKTPAPAHDTVEDAFGDLS
ncbi:hypothetical protein [Oxalicibacterium solurbis]|uniref:Uncharacterized protein n=1 Tax=Oxalicibacterium solurbis TaxID=69280 RepID=A0A8J3F5Y1_9BURK|nr:hypothetical protein [Oxalicibacterium solurbis]GGI54016.1 hypothetical protein GCM10011430_11900 [Oxalicibacterium solurbis]